MPIPPMRSMRHDRTARLGQTTGLGCDICAPLPRLPAPIQPLLGGLCARPARG
jgi:hypothetical protein